MADAVGGGRPTRVVNALVLVALACSANRAGRRASGRVQGVPAGPLVLAAVAVSFPLVDLANLEPHGWTAIGPAAALPVWTFAGQEVITHRPGSSGNRNATCRALPGTRRCSRRPGCCRWSVRRCWNYVGAGATSAGVVREAAVGRTW